ncbi:shikimate kinase [Streptomyces sp. ISL-100]|uniref:shikimate kinase n=1 Tax=Streptomyces sp. ISL-100 TaxID=2819173 RepID=UPI001BE789C2|nr:shikimate kinase [Streptomyces sp. ISL-100]MBT2397423.1 shikimate kinase [Streptomyces sp. ISL-100]
MRAAAVLIGVPGSGKTTVGALLAQHLGVAFRDTDHDIAAACDMPVPDFVRHHGEARFRELEREAVRAALDEHDGVLALGGGAVLDPATQRRLAGHRVVHLQVALHTALARIPSAEGRPLLAGDVESRLREVFRVRGPVYRRLARLHVDADTDSADDTAQRLVQALKAPA